MFSIFRDISIFLSRIFHGVLPSVSYRIIEREELIVLAG